LLQLDYIQLHGDETPEYFNRIQTKTKTIKLIKAFRVNEDFDFSTTKNYEKYCTYFLFDTKKTVTNAVHPPARSKGGNAGVRGFSHSEKYLPKPVPALVRKMQKPSEISHIRNSRVLISIVNSKSNLL